MSKSKNIKIERRVRRRGRIRAKISGTADCPRLSVYKSNRNVYAQLIDDVKGVTLVSAHSREAVGANDKKTAETPAQTEFELGKLLAKKAAALKIAAVVFDRGGYKYHGRVKALADGARAGGLIF